MIRQELVRSCPLSRALRKAASTYRYGSCGTMHAHNYVLISFAESHPLLAQLQCALPFVRATPQGTLTFSQTTSPYRTKTTTTPSVAFPLFSGYGLIHQSTGQLLCAAMMMPTTYRRICGRSSRKGTNYEPRQKSVITDDFFTPSSVPTKNFKTCG
jgi:hypothetical protein